MFWVFRWKTPKGVQQIVIRTKSDLVADAEKLAHAHVNAQQTPACRFIAVEPWCKASDDVADQVSPDVFVPEYALPPAKADTKAKSAA